MRREGGDLLWQNEHASLSAPWPSLGIPVAVVERGKRLYWIERGEVWEIRQDRAFREMVEQN